jgi:thiamine-monophosphate kinase
MPLIAGDDYELCFTLPENCAESFPVATCVGRIEAESGLRISRAGRSEIFEVKGFEHFS